MKLIIQIPCLNEEESLPATLADLPRHVAGFDTVEWLVIDDGSSDDTVRVARECGVEHIVRHTHNRGLARAFTTGIDACLARGADVIVNTDADNQYDARDIATLVAPITEHSAQFVIGARPIATIEHFSPTKKLLQGLGTWVVRFTSGTEVRDAPSGFRALSREAAQRLNVFDSYSYTLESVIQAGRLGIRVVSVPIRVNGETRPSRLVRSVPRYVMRSLLTIVRALLVYSPGRVFVALGAVPLFGGSLLAVRWLFLFMGGGERTHVPSLIAAAVLLISGFLLWLCALLGELISINRRLLEDALFRLRQASRDKRDGSGDVA